MVKVLAFGFFPFSEGGKVKHGLATGVYDLHKNMNKSQSMSVILAAISCTKEEIYKDGFRIIGLSYPNLIKYAIVHPLVFIKSIIIAVRIYFFSKTEKMLKTFLKLLFYNYAIKKINPDIVHYHGCFDAIISKFIKTDAKKVLRIHGINGNDFSKSNHKKFQLLEQYVTKSYKFNLVTFVSHDNEKKWQELYGSFGCRTEVIFNGYDPQIFSPTKGFKNKLNNKVKLITVATINNNKGQYRVIEALKKLEDRFEYLIIGEGDSKSIRSLYKLINECQCDVRIEDYMKQAKLNKYLNSYDYFILPSIREGFGMAFLEAIAIGLKVIIPKDLPIVVERNIINKKNSILLKDASVSSIYNTLKLLDKPKYNKFEVSQTVCNLSWDKIKDSYVELLLTL